MKQRSPGFFLIRDRTNGKYLYNNTAVLSDPYKWKDGKLNAAVFSKQKARRLIVYLRRQGADVERKNA